MKNNKNNIIKNGMIRLLGGERWQMIRVSVFAIIISLLAGAVILISMGKNPLAAYGNLLQGSGLLPKPRYAGGSNMFTDFMSLLDAMTPMIFASLAVTAAMKIGLFNIGVSGQMLAAGICAHMITRVINLPAPLAKPLVLFIGVIAGALIGALIGALKFKFNINEVVSSIMLNYIIMYLTTFYINTFYVNPVSRQSEPISDAARLTLSGLRISGLKLDIPIAFPIAVLTAILLNWFLSKTVSGFEIRAVGLSGGAARYVGIDIGRTIIFTMTLSGALGGLAGVSYFCGYYASIQPGVVPSMGFDAIAVCLLGGIHPVGCVFSSFLITVISKGTTYLSCNSCFRGLFGIFTRLGQPRRARVANIAKFAKFTKFIRRK